MKTTEFQFLAFDHLTDYLTILPALQLGYRPRPDAPYVDLCLMWIWWTVGVRFYWNIKTPK